jgi:acyl carrier protein
MTKNAVIELLAREVKRPAGEISLNSGMSDLGIDSLKAIVILAELEDHFKIVIPNEAIGSMRTVGEIVSKIDELRRDIHSK